MTDDEPRATILAFEHVSVRFGGLLALNDVSFEVGTHEIVGLIGPNGAGKTTAFNVACGFIKPDLGRPSTSPSSVTGDSSPPSSRAPGSRARSRAWGSSPTSACSRTSWPARRAARGAACGPRCSDCPSDAATNASSAPRRWRTLERFGVAQFAARAAQWHPLRHREEGLDRPRADGATSPLDARRARFGPRRARARRLHRAHRRAARLHERAAGRAQHGLRDAARRPAGRAQLRTGHRPGTARATSATTPTSSPPTSGSTTSDPRRGSLGELRRHARAA